MRISIPGAKEELHFSSYFDSPGERIGVYSVLRCLKGRIGMLFDAVWQSGNLWFPLVEES